MIELSVVIPVRNEAESLDQLYQELTVELERWGRPYEVLVVDDGSTDDSFAKLARLQAGDLRWRIIRFRRNFGQTAAFAAGFAHARGRFIVTADGDLQNDPRDIPGMIALAEAKDADIVAGWRKDRKDPFFSRRLPSTIANWIISRATGVNLHDYGCSLKVFRADVVKPMKLYGEMHRFLPAIASEFGVSIEEHEVNHRPRRRGQSKYGISRTIKVIFDLMTIKFMAEYHTKPIYVFGTFGIIALVVSVLSGVYALFMKLAGRLGLPQYHADFVETPLPILCIVMFAISVQFFLMGLLAELLVRTYHESQDKAIYAVRERVGFD